LLPLAPVDIILMAMAKLKNAMALFDAQLIWL